MAIKLEVMMKGKLKVKPNDKNTVELSDMEEPVSVELLFGFLVHDPVNGVTEYRSQVLESGEYREDSYYETVTDLMIRELL